MNVFDRIFHFTMVVSEGEEEELGRLAETETLESGRLGGLRSLCHHFLDYFWQYFDGQNGIKSRCLNKMPGRVNVK